MVQVKEVVKVMMTVKLGAHVKPIIKVTPRRNKWRSTEQWLPR